MRKTILFPTDFSIQSLNIVKSVLNNGNDNTRYDIILLHGMDAGDSITDLLFVSRSRWIQSLTNPAFEDACDIIRNKFESKIRSMRKDVFTGFGQSAFNSYLEANRVDEAYLPVNSAMELSGRRSFDILPLLHKSGLPVKEVALQETTPMHEKGRLAEVFHGQMVLN